MNAFIAFRVHNDDGQIRAGLEEIHLHDLNEGEVVIKAAWSDVNFKDALAATGKGKIMRRFPMVGGIDVAGTVHASEDSRFKPGQEVLVTGCGLSEDYDGGYAQYARVKADFVIPLPERLSLRESMVLGTAGFTAALAIERLEHAGLQPQQGPVLVTGATGGVGSLAIDMLNKAGYEVAALTGKADQVDYLKELGADEVLISDQLDFGKRPLEKARWAGAIDALGGDTLAWLTKTVQPWGGIASIGLAAGWDLNTTVMPFILRGVSLIGIDSVHCPRDLREKVWQRLAEELKPRHMDRIVAKEVSLNDISGVFQALMDRTLTGRILVRIDH